MPAGARPVGLDKQIKRPFERCILRGRIIRAATAIAKWKIGKIKAWYARIFNNIQRTSHNNRCDAGIFGCTRSNRNRLMAYRAIGNGYNRIHLVRLQHFDQLRGIIIDIGTLRAVGWKPIDMGGDTVNNAGLFCPFQGGQRQIGSAILCGGMGAINGDMRDSQIRFRVNGQLID